MSETQIEKHPRVEVWRGGLTTVVTRDVTHRCCASHTTLHASRMELPRLVSWMIQVGSRATESRSGRAALLCGRSTATGDRSRVESPRVETIVSPHRVDRRDVMSSLMVRGADDSRVVNLRVSSSGTRRDNRSFFACSTFVEKHVVSVHLRHTRTQSCKVDVETVTNAIDRAWKRASVQQKPKGFSD